jgi:hypothetical protein
LRFHFLNVLVSFAHDASFGKFRLPRGRVGIVRLFVYGAKPNPASATMVLDIKQSARHPLNYRNPSADKARDGNRQAVTLLLW